VGQYAPDKMPFKSEKQRAFLHAKHPEIAEKWTKEHGATIKKSSGRKLKTKRKIRRKI
jgi:hypothetical protein